MSGQGSPGGAGDSAAGDSTGIVDSITPSLGARNPRAKWERVLQALLERAALHRFDAERDPRVRDHTLPTTISQLQRRGLRIERRLIEVPGFAGSVAHIAEYSLPADQYEKAREILCQGERLTVRAVSVHVYRDTVLSAAGPKDPSTRLVCLAIARFVNSRTLTTFVSQPTLAEATGLAERSVRTHVSLAAADGWLELSRRRRGKNWALTNYRLVIPIRAPAKIAAAIYSGGSSETHDGPANGAVAPAILADGPAILALGPANNSTGERKGLPPISEEGSRIRTRTGSRSLASSLAAGPLASDGPQEPTAERMRKARITVEATPNLGIEKLQSMYSLSRDQAKSIVDGLRKTRGDAC